jgi:hypothetical protein
MFSKPKAASVSPKCIHGCLPKASQLERTGLVSATPDDYSTDILARFEQQVIRSVVLNPSDPQPESAL